MRTFACVALSACLVGGAVVCADGPQSAEAVRVRYVWQAGMTTYYRTVTTQDMTMGEGAEARPSHDVMGMLIRQEVYSVKDDGTGRIAMTVVRVRKENDKGAAGKTVYDSAEPEKSTDDPAKKMYGAMVGHAIIVELTPEGSMVREEGTKELLDAMFGAMADSKDSPELQKTMGKFKEGMQKGLEGAVKGIMGTGVEGLGKERHVGEEWTSEHEGAVPIFGNVKGGVTKKLVSVERVDGRRIMTTSTKGDQDMKPGADGKELMPGLPMRMKADIHSETRGVEVFDLDRGRLVRSESTMKGNGTMSFTIPDFGKSGGSGGAEKEETKKLSMIMRTVMELVGPEDPILPGSK